MKLAAIVALVLAIVLPAGARAEMVRQKSTWSVQDTMNRIESVLSRAPLRIFARIDHAAGAKKAGLKLRPTQLILFGNPKAGTVLMNAKQQVAIDLPMKILVWQDAAGAVWVGYTAPAEIARRHGIPLDHKVVKGMTGALAKLTAAALKK